MPLTPATASPLLGLCLCLCLLLGDVAGTDVGKTQPEGESLNGEQTRPTLPPHLVIPKNIGFPTFTKNGYLYFDLAGGNETRTQILRLRENESVQGITATSRECPVRTLVLESKASYILDEDLFTYCPITTLTLKGKRWCRKEAELLERREVVNIDESATCQDAWYYIKSNPDDYNYSSENDEIAVSYKMVEGIQKLQELGNISCPIEQCDCRWYFKNDSYTINMDCEGRGLTDDAMAKMHMIPSNVTQLELNRNNLSSMDTVLQYLKPIHDKIQVLTLDHNRMTDLPRLGRLFPRIVDISLVNNSIVKIDLKEFEALLARKKLYLDLESNPITCDDTMTTLKSIIYKHCHTLCDNYVKKLTCIRQSDGKPVRVYEKSIADHVEPVNWWTVLNVTLGILNVVMITLVVDLALVLAKRGGTGRRPLMDYAVCGLKALLCYLCRGGRVRSNKRD